MNRIVRTTILAVAACAALAFAGTALAAPAPTLGGEWLTNSSAATPQGSCLSFPAGFTYTVTGNAYGAYAGTFSETGTVKTAYADSLYAGIVSVQTTFTITSAAGTVTGTRSWTAGTSTGSGGCESGWWEDESRIVASRLAYTATLPDGTTDYGTSSMSFYDTSTIGSFDARFVSTRPAIVDTDADGVADTADNCPTVANPSQADLDVDGAGDACDPDDDADGVADAADNCATTPNADQADLDHDGVGNACDATDDRTPAEKAADLVEAARGYGPGRSLEAKAAGILAAIEAGRNACGKLGAFANEVEAQRGTSLTDAKADELAAAAGAIAADLGC